MNKIIKPVYLIVLLLFLSFLNPGCLDSKKDDKIGVVVTIVPQKEFVEKVGGERVKVSVMVPEGQEPHSYAPTPSQMRDVAEAEIYFSVGSGLEFELVWLDTLREVNPDMEIVDGSKGITLLPMNWKEENLSQRAEEIFKQSGAKNVTAGRNETDAPTIEETERCYNISFKKDNEKWSGTLKFKAGEESELFIFLEHTKEELNLSIKESGGKEVELSEEGKGGEIFSWYSSAIFKNVTYYLNFGPTDFNTTHLLILKKEKEEKTEHEKMDPHIWLSIKNAEKMVLNFLDVLKRVDPEYEDYYTENAQAYISELEKLDSQIAKELEPFKGKKFMVYHPSFGYFAKDYGLVQIAIEEEGKEPTPKGIEAIINQAKKEGIKVIFISPQFSQHHAEVIKEEIDGEVVTINPLAKDYKDNIEKIKTSLVEGFKKMEVK